MTSVDIIDLGSPIKNRSDRKELYTSYMGVPKTEEVILDIIDTFDEAVSRPTYLVYKSRVREKLRFVLAAKRGNSVYSRKLKLKIEKWVAVMMDNGLQKMLVRPKKGHRKIHISNCLFASFTVDQKKVGYDLDYAWQTIDEHFNRFMTSFKYHSGAISVLKCTEAQKNYYPHIHTLIVTENSFDCFKHISTQGKNKGKISWRVNKKRQIFDKLWKLGFVDVVAVNAKKKDSMGFITNYIVKSIVGYVIKDMTKVTTKKNKQAMASLALGWYYKKRCISISTNQLFPDLNSPCVTQEYLAQVFSLFDECCEEPYDFIGIMHFSATDDPPDEFEVGPDHDYYKFFQMHPDTKHHFKSPEPEVKEYPVLIYPDGTCQLLMSNYNKEVKENE